MGLYVNILYYMAEKFTNVSEEVKEFYYYLGLLSTKFAILEYNMLQLLGLMVADDFVLINTLLERNTLYQNVELLKKLNKYRGFQEELVDILIKKIFNIRINRNIFIHGIWKSPRPEKNDLVVICTEPKMLYEENESERKWTHQRHHSFRLSFIKEQVEEIDDIILRQNYLIGELKEL